MTDPYPFDLHIAHRYFAAKFFNAAWTLLDKPNLTAQEVEQMISLAHGSLAHWRQRSDCTNENLSVGYWQLSRIYAVAGEAENARKYGELCRQASELEGPFFRAYAHEALARAAKTAGEQAPLAEHRQLAQQLADEIADAEHRALLLKDLESLA